METVSPLIKWPGGKRWIVGKVAPQIEGTFRRYIEPFFGGGALFFALKVEKAIVCDLNAELVNCYLAMRENILKVYRIASAFPKGKKGYYEIRDQWKPKDRFKEAARFIYLLRHSWNGLYRVNQDGHFNVPYRRRSYKTRISQQQLLKVQEKLRRATIRSADFQKLIDCSSRGDLIFADPPYFCDAQGGFHRYNSVAFSVTDQKRLYRSLVAAERRGSSWILTNADYAFVKLFRAKYRVFRIRRKQTLAADPGKRRNVYEYVVLSNNKELARLRNALQSRKPRNVNVRRTPPIARVPE
jgi:DNA adenine methylase